MAAATNRRVSSAKPARASVPAWSTQVWVGLTAGPSNPAHLTRSAGPASVVVRVDPMPDRSGTSTQSRRTVPSTVGITVGE